MDLHWILGGLGGALVGLAACGGQPTSLPPSDQPLTLTDAVRQTVSTQLKNYKPPASRVELTFTTFDQMASNSLSVSLRQTYQMQDSGLWAVVTRGTNSSTGTGGLSEGSSLCGLVMLINVGRGQAVRTMFGIQTTGTSVTRRRVAALQTDAAAICNPAPGSRFSYTVEMETAFSNSFGVSTSGTGSYRETCEVAAAARPAQEVDPALKGLGLLVTCDRAVAKTGQQSVERFMFLPDVGLFLEIDSVSNDNKHRATYTNVTVAP
jgi:hypothetical protein